MRHPVHVHALESPSSRRAWIEIPGRVAGHFEEKPVALLTEGVDRNPHLLHLLSWDGASPSSRRAWIEILISRQALSTTQTSPSSRRAWIEICQRTYKSSWRLVALLTEGVDRNLSAANMARCTDSVALLTEGVDRNSADCPRMEREGKSPSSRRAWIEILGISSAAAICLVALLTEGVDRNVGLSRHREKTIVSPSSRRAWIEISVVDCITDYNMSRPPHGGRG